MINQDIIKWILEPSPLQAIRTMMREDSKRERLLIALEAIKLKFMELYPERLCLNTPLLESLEIINSLTEDLIRERMKEVSHDN